MRRETRLTAGTVMGTRTRRSRLVLGSLLVTVKRRAYQPFSFSGNRVVALRDGPSKYFISCGGYGAPDQDRIGGKPGDVVEADETL